MTFECVGVTVPNTHDIDKLVRMSKNNGSKVVLTEWLEEKLATHFPKDYSPESDFEWNCMYQIF